LEEIIGEHIEMALKDWKSVLVAGGNRWDKNGDARSGMVYVSEKQFDKNNPYKVEIYKSYFGGVSERPETIKRFKTKVQALKFARSYRRTH